MDKMIEVDIPGWGTLEVQNVVFDLNGTLATDGKIPAEVKQRIKALSENVKLYVLTVDTQGTATQEMKDLKAELVKLGDENSKESKFEFLKTLDLEKTVAIGNGSNDQLILKEAALGIAVLGDEGMSLQAFKSADVVVRSISDAFDLFLKPKRLIATLRE